MSPLLFLLLVFLAGVLVIFGSYSIFSDLYLRDRERVSQRVDEELRKRQRDRARAAMLFKSSGPMAESHTQELEAPSNLSHRLRILLEQSGMNLTPNRLFVMMAIVGFLCGAIAGAIFQSFLVGFVIALGCSFLPLAYVSRKRRVRLEKMNSQLPDAFDLMAQVIRAGQTVSQALLAVADEFPPPLAAEFAYCYEQQNLGLSPELAMRDLANRTGLLEIKIFVLALLVQQQTGGNLVELLDKLAKVIRERYRVRGKILSLTAEGRIQALVLLGLPPLLLVAILVLNRTYAQALLNYPIILLGTLVAEVLGALWIRRIINFDF